MSLERLAQEIARSLARHQSRGLVDDARGMAEVVVHGRVDLLAVAEDALAASVAEFRPVRRSWGGWFLLRADARRRLDRHERAREKLAARLETAGNQAEAAITRLKRREIASN